MSVNSTYDFVSSLLTTENYSQFGQVIELQHLASHNNVIFTVIDKLGNRYNAEVYYNSDTRQISAPLIPSIPSIPLIVLKIPPPSNQTNSINVMLKSLWGRVDDLNVSTNITGAKFKELVGEKSNMSPEDIKRIKLQYRVKTIDKGGMVDMPPLTFWIAEPNSWGGVDIFVELDDNKTLQEQNITSDVFMKYRFSLSWIHE